MRGSPARQGRGPSPNFHVTVPSATGIIGSTRWPPTKQVLGRLGLRAAASCWPDTKLPRACNPPCGPAGPSLGGAVRSAPEDEQFRRRIREWLSDNLTGRFARFSALPAVFLATGYASYLTDGVISVSSPHPDGPRGVFPWPPGRWKIGPCTLGCCSVAAWSPTASEPPCIGRTC